MTAFVVGLTGPIGAGKSTVAAMLRELGAKVLDADAIAKDELLRGTVGYSAVIQRFGPEVLGPDKEVDRRKLAETVFADPRELQALEQILWPRVIARVLEARSMLDEREVLVVEAIKLLETSLRRACDRIWVVVAPRRLLLERLALRGLSEEDALRRLGSQSSEDEFIAVAHAVIVNDGERGSLRQAVEGAWAEVRAPTG